jgi:hypothetical protein
MQGVEKKYCDLCINALIGANQQLMGVSCSETLQKVPYGKGDTLGLDAIPELIITDRLRRFDNQAILITEELDDQAHRHWPRESDPLKQPFMFFSDPTDRSYQLKEFLQRISEKNPTAKVCDIMKEIDSGKLWEEMFEAPVSITGPTGSITCVRNGKVIFSVILNYVTSDICVATDIDIYQYNVKNILDCKEEITLSEICKNGKRICFPGVKGLNYSLDDCKRFVTFLGKTGYLENLNDSNIFVEKSDEFAHHRKPPGPPRALYLSELQNGYGPVGFILANGEKIGEWIHWLSFVKYARNEDGGHALQAYEISIERPWTKEGMLMSTFPPYSLFCDDGKNCYIDISRLSNFKRPSQFRCMMVIVPYNNERIINVLEQHQYRRITGFF